MATDENELPVDETPDGEEARGRGAGVLGTHQPLAASFDASRTPRDLQEDLGDDPTLIDEDSGD